MGSTSALGDRGTTRNEPPRRREAQLAAGFTAFSSSNKLVSGTGGTLLLGSEVFSIADAALAAKRFNERHARARQKS